MWSVVGLRLSEKWSVDKCSEEEWSVVGWILNEKKWSVYKCSEVEWSVVGLRLSEKWSVDKCSEEEWSVVGRRLNEKKWSVDKCSEVEWSVVVLRLSEKWNVDKCSEEEWSVVGRILNEKWSVDKCSEVEWSVVGWSLNDKWSVDTCIVVEWSVVSRGGLKVLSNRVSFIIRMMVQWKTRIICLQSIYCKHWNNYIITVQDSPLLVQCTYASAWQARRFRGKEINSDTCAATHAAPTEPHRRLVSTTETPFLNFSVHSYTCVRLIHLSPYWILIRRWISIGFTPSLNKNFTTLRCSCLVHCCKGTAILSNCFPGSYACRRRANAIFW